MLLRLLVVLSILTLSACSTYKTNTDTEFESTDLGNRQPAIYIGKLDEPSDQLDFQGWIKAIVKKPHMFSDKPTKQMADIVLSELAIDKNAHAVTFVEYKYNILGAIEARGQAVRIKGVETNVKPEPEPEQPAEVVAVTHAEKLQVASPQEIIEMAQTPEQREKGANRYAISQSLQQSFPKAFVGLNKAQIDEVLARLQVLRKMASDDKSLERYQAITEIIEILEKANR